MLIVTSLVAVFADQAARDDTLDPVRNEAAHSFYEKRLTPEFDTYLRDSLTVTRPTQDDKKAVPDLPAVNDADWGMAVTTSAPVQFDLLASKSNPAEASDSASSEATTNRPCQLSFQAVAENLSASRTDLAQNLISSRSSDFACQPTDVD